MTNKQTFIFTWKERKARVTREQNRREHEFNMHIMKSTLRRNPIACSVMHSETQNKSIYYIVAALKILQVMITFIAIQAIYR